MKGKSVLTFSILCVALAAALFLSVGIGAVRVAPVSIFKILLHGAGFTSIPLPDSRDVTILIQLRLPRILAAMLVGAALAVCGVVMQGLFRNPMASPEILGISSGGSLGAVIAITTGLSSWSLYTMPLLTICGALVAAACIYLLSTSRGATSLLFIIISGMAISSLFNGFTSALLLFARHYEVAEYVFWTMGGLDGRSWQHILFSAPILIPGIVVLSFFSREMNLFSLGEEGALALGVHVERTKRLLLALCAVITGVSIAVAGPIGFIGLLIPHLLRFIVGPDHRVLIPASALGGALFLMLCDLLGRSIMPPFEIRVGIITAILGSPYLLSIIIRLQRRSARGTPGNARQPILRAPGTPGNARQPILRARGLRYRVGSTLIIDGIDIDVERGECVGVIGPNGAGKTTLLRMLAGLLAPSQGNVTLGGRDIAATESRARARSISFMSQETSLSFPFTVMETLLMGRYPHLKRFEQESADDRERARRMLSYVGLSGLEERIIDELSGGERQLVLFAKALVQDTETLVLDEPSASLDIRHQDRIFSMARELAREKRAVITSVHNLGVAAQYCSRLVLLDRGRVAAEGRAEQVLQSAVLDAVYGIRTAVSSNAATGSLTVTVIPWRANTGGRRIHLIGGAGSAVNLTRELYRLGCVLSGGIAHEYDSDEKLWKNLGIECPTIGAFSRITDEDVAAAAALVREADLTILCSFPVGQGNLGNLKLAGLARNLIILETETRDAPRGFVTAEGRTLFQGLLSRGRLMLYEEVLAELERPRETGQGPGM